MFVLNKDRIVEWPVTIEEPVDGGKTEPREVTISYKLIKQSEYDAAFEKGRDPEIARTVVVGWGGFQEQCGSAIVPLPFSEAAREQLIELPYIRSALVLGYIACSQGAKRKNLPRPAVTGPAGEPNGATATTASLPH